jgi:hypothetical protein
MKSSFEAILIVSWFHCIVYGCETLPFALREEQRFRVLRKIIGNWRKLCNKEPHDLYSLPNINKMIRSRKMKWTMHEHVWER